MSLFSAMLVMATIGDPIDEAGRKELKTLQGDWILESFEQDGEKHEPGKDDLAILTINGNKWSFDATKEEGEIVAIDAGTNPKLIDFRSISRLRPATVGEGIYKLDGDTLIICLYKGSDKKRPTSFDVSKEGNTSLMKLKRMKK